METAQAIRKLLFLEDCVIIPGLGGFVSRYRPAVIDKVTGTFTPPAKEIVFNAGLVQNDGVLVSFLSVKNRISPEAAREMIDRFVDETKRKLDLNQPVYIDGIGQFIRDKSLEIRFQAEPGTNLFPDSFGLSSFHLHQVSRHADPVIQPRLIARAEESPRTVEFEVAELVKPRANHNIRRIAIAMPLLIAFSLLPYHSRVTDTLTSSPASMVPEPSLFRLNYPDSARADSVRTIEFPVNRAAAVAVEVEAVKGEEVKEVRGEEVKEVKEVRGEEVREVRAVKVEAGVGKYPVIAGCFKIKDNADRLHKKLIDKGYPSSIMTSRTGLFKVIVQSFASRTEALTGLDRIKKAEPDMQVWVAL